MKSISGQFLVTALLVAAAFGAQADTLPQTERVTMRSTETLPAVDHIVVRRA
jgi:hypothetical protein